MSFLFRIAFCLTAWAAACCSFGAELSAEYSARSVYLGDSLIVTVKLDGAIEENSDPAFPDLPADCGVVKIGGMSPMRMMSETIVNGKRNVTKIERSEWNFEVTPHTAGTFDLGKVVLNHGGREYKAVLPPLSVVGPEENEFVTLELRADKTDLLITDKFRVTLTVSINALPPPYENENPFEQMRLFIPYIVGSGSSVFRLAGGASAESVLSGMVSSRGFAINEFRVPSADPFGFGFRGLGSSSYAKFDLPRVPAERADGKKVWTYEFSLDMEAVSAGSETIGPVYARGTIYKSDAISGEISKMSVYVGSSGVDASVSAPPESGRPAGYCGIISTNLTVGAELDAQTCREGDPLELRVSVSGYADRGRLKAPDLASVPGFAGRFRFFGEVSEKTSGSGTVFIYRMRPLESGTVEVPSVEIPFFNSAVRKYEIARSAPVPLRVDPAPEIQLSSGGGTRESSGLTGMLSPAGITVSTDALVPPAQFSAGEIFFWAAVPPLVYLCLRTLLKVWLRRDVLVGSVRRRSAGARAAHAFSDADTPQGVMAAAALLLRDRFGERRHGITPAEAVESLERGGVPEELRNEFRSKLEDVFNSAYVPGEAGKTAFREAKEKLRPVFEKIRTFSKLAAVMILLWAAPAWASADSGAVEFMWRQANAAAAHSGTPEEFRNAAGLYRAVIDAAPCGAGVYFNYGVMEMLGGEPAAAVEALRRAEMLEGYSEEIERNMIYAYRLASEDTVGDGAPDGSGSGAAAGLPWFRDVLPLHYMLSVYERVCLALIAWAIGWVFLAVRLFRRSKAAMAAAVLLFVVCACMSSSALYSMHVMSKPLYGVTASGGESAAVERSAADGAVLGEVKE